MNGVQSRMMSHLFLVKKQEMELIENVTESVLFKTLFVGGIYNEFHTINIPHHLIF